MDNYKKWKNQYIDLVNSKPEYILTCDKNTDLSKQRHMLDMRNRCYQSCICELGCGSGGHLIELAKHETDTLCIGFELRFKRIYRTAEKAEKANLQNLLLIHARAEQLSDFFEANSLDRIYVNFPDPWDKLRWQKHHLLSPEYLATLVSLLKPNGLFSYKTDHARRFNEVLTAIQSQKILEIEKLSRDLHNSEYIASNIFSEFECLFRSQRQAVMFLECKKIAKLGTVAL